MVRPTTRSQTQQRSTTPVYSSAGRRESFEKFVQRSQNSPDIFDVSSESNETEFRENQNQLTPSPSKRRSTNEIVASSPKKRKRERVERDRPALVSERRVNTRVRRSLLTPTSSSANTQSNATSNNQTTTTTTSTTTSNATVPAQRVSRRKRGVGVNKRKRMTVEEEIRYYQRHTHLIIPKASFAKLVKEIADDCGAAVERWEGNAMRALHEASEDFVVETLRNANVAAKHANRTTVTEKDMRVLKAINKNL